LKDDNENDSDEFYYFKDGERKKKQFVYVGHTKNITQRFRNHLDLDKTKLSKFQKMVKDLGVDPKDIRFQVLFPKYLPDDRSGNIERSLISYFRNNEEFYSLNVSPGGRIGNRSRYSISEIVLDVIKNIKENNVIDENDFINRYKIDYDRLRRYNRLSQINSELGYRFFKRVRYSEEELINISKKYQSSSEFKKNNLNAWIAAKNRNLLNVLYPSDEIQLTESENKKSNYINLIKELVEPFKNEDCVCEINVSYDDEDDMYSVYVVTSTEELREKFFYVDGIQQYLLKLRVNINKTIVGYLPIENLYVGSYGKPNCEWNPTISEAHKVEKDEYVELYRDKDFILTIPLTHEASKKYGSDTKWCTTKKDCNKDFKKHTELGVLGYIVVRDKELKERLGSNAFALYRLKGDDITRTIVFDDQNNEYRNGESWLGNKFDRVDKLFQFYKMMNKYNDYFEKQDFKETIEETKEISKKDLSEDMKYNKVNAVLNRIMSSKYEWWKGIEIQDILFTKKFQIGLIKAVLKVDKEWGEEQWGEYNMHMAFPGNDGWEDNETYELVTLGDIIGGKFADDLSQEILDVLKFTGVNDPRVNSPRMSFRAIMLKFE
jgi:hypothetical protein